MIRGPLKKLNVLSSNSSSKETEVSENEASVLVDVSIRVKKAVKKYPAIKEHLLKMLGSAQSRTPRRSAVILVSPSQSTEFSASSFVPGDFGRCE